MDPTNTKALQLRGASLFKKGALEAAIKDYSQLLHLNAADITALYNRGTAYDKLGKLEKAIEDYTRVLELDPKHVNAAYARAATQNRRGNFHAAIIDYQLVTLNSHTILILLLGIGKGFGKDVVYQFTSEKRKSSANGSKF